MCGIAGFISQSAESLAPTVLARQLQCIEHRGPDGQGRFVEGRAALGMQRLAIIDLATGEQPFFSHDGRLVLVFNGEIYNYRTLRQQLQACGQVFISTSDTEVIMRGIEAWGLAECLQRLNGMFAFALWDRREQVLTLARDRLGIKPLYVYHDQQQLVFGSEIKSILQHPLVPRQLDLRGLANFLTWGHAVAPQTMFTNIHKLLPGHTLHYSAQSGAVHAQTYWQLSDLQPITDLTPSAAQAECYDRLREAVRLQLVSAVPLGAFLSGGLDSSIIVGLMTQLGAAPVQTFSVGFDASNTFNELADAQQVAEHFGCTHHALRLQASDLPALLERLIWHYDEPFGDAAAIPVLALAEFARRHVTVVLTGEGSDEQWGGYRRYQAQIYTNLLRRMPGRSMLAAVLRQLPRARRIKQIARALEIADPAQRYATWLTVLHADQRQRLLHTDVLSALGDYDPAASYRQMYPTDARHAITRMGAADLQTWLPDTYLEKVDKGTMAASLEARVPFLDHTLVEWTMRLPPQFKLRGRTTKWLLRQAFQDMLPQRTLQKPKHGFAVPTDPWFRGSLYPWVRQVLLDQRTIQRGLFQPQALETILTAHQTGRETNDALIWLLLNLELWQRRFLDATL